MNWGSLNNEYSGFAWKRLSPHEVNAEVSNGHEFQGVGLLAKLLGKEERKSIPTSYYFLGDSEEGSPACQAYVNSTASWYDARAGNPNRSAEWRLYYPNEVNLIQSECQDGDLMILGIRTDATLSVFLVPAETVSEAAIMGLLGINTSGVRAVTQKNRKGDLSSFSTFFRDVGLNGDEIIAQLNDSFRGVRRAASDREPFENCKSKINEDVRIQKLVQVLVDRWPDTLGSSDDVVSVVKSSLGFSKEEFAEKPDYVFNYLLELSEASYRGWEKQVFSNFLNPIRWNEKINDIDLGQAISKKWMSFRQSRVSRAGRVMELYLNDIFMASGVKFEWGAVLPGNKRPDFVFPNSACYIDENFPVGNLRLLGAKTSMKERWRQILAEGPKISHKHGITRDAAITAATFKAMEEARFTLVMPESVIELYPSKPSNLITLEEFIDEVRSTQSKGT